MLKYSLLNGLLKSNGILKWAASSLRVFRLNFSHEDLKKKKKVQVSPLNNEEIFIEKMLTVSYMNFHC